MDLSNESVNAPLSSVTVPFITTESGKLNATTFANSRGSPSVSNTCP